MRRWQGPARCAATLFALMGLHTTAALAQAPVATATGQAAAQVVAPLVIAQQADLSFGAVFASSAPGAVTVGTNGTLTYSGGAQPACIGGACLETHPASFAVTGEPGRDYVIHVPASVTANGSTTGGSPAPPLSVDGLNATSTNGASGNTAWRLDSRGRDSFDVGGTLHLPANLPSARYQATIPVIVVYG